jgi:hypothetical protein
VTAQGAAPEVTAQGAAPARTPDVGSAVAVRDLVKRYDGRAVVSGLSLTVAPG